jgi:hypothetical protein
LFVAIVSFIRIGVGDAEEGVRADLAGFHVLGGAVVVVIVAEQMKRSVHDQVRGMIFQRNRHFGRLALANAAGEDEVAEHHLGSVAAGLGKLGRLGLGEGQDVGRLVLAAPAGVERLHFLVAGQPHRQLDRTFGAGELRKGACRDGRFGGGSDERFPAGATVPLRIGVYGVVESHASGPGAFIRLNDAPDQRVPHHVRRREWDDRDPLDALQALDRVVEARLAALG